MHPRMDKGFTQLIDLSIGENKNRLLSELFGALGMPQPTPISSVSLTEVDARIKAFGYEKAYQQFNLNLILLAGECVRSKRSGSWVVEKNTSYPLELTPVLLDAEGRRYELDINNQLRKDAITKRRYSIADIVEFALLPKLKI